MGYHVIIDPQDFPIKYTYVDQVEKLIEIEGITEKSIIFQGERGNPPQQVGVSLDFQRLAEEWYRAGLRAQVVFAKLARMKGLVLEELSQDQESFKAYAKAIKGPLKRGDFLIRNIGNIEIEVKCRTFYGRGKHRYFYFSEDDLQKHLNMEKATRTSVVVAVFQRKLDRPVEDTLCMIKVDRIQELARVLEKDENDYGWAYRIPLRETVSGFDLLSEYGVEQVEEVNTRFEHIMVEYDATEEEPYVWVAYYKSQEHLDWIMSNGIYNMRMGTDRGAICLGRKETGARYILLHSKGETATGKLFRILENGPKVYNRRMLMHMKYPGIPNHESYLVYRITPVYEKELQNRIWDISAFSGYRTKRSAALPFIVSLSELMK